MLLTTNDTTFSGLCCRSLGQVTKSNHRVTGLLSKQCSGSLPLPNSVSCSLQGATPSHSFLSPPRLQGLVLTDPGGRLWKAFVFDTVFVFHWCYCPLLESVLINCADVVLSVWHNLIHILEEEILTEKTPPTRLSCRQVCAPFSWMMIDVGRPQFTVSGAIPGLAGGPVCSKKSGWASHEKQ